MEFLTLTGIIFNALMQGYVCANSIYVYLIENIENEFLSHQNVAFGLEESSSNDLEGGNACKVDRVS